MRQGFSHCYVAWFMSKDAPCTQYHRVIGLYTCKSVNERHRKQESEEWKLRFFFLSDALCTSSIHSNRIFFIYTQSISSAVCNDIVASVGAKTYWWENVRSVRQTKWECERNTPNRVCYLWVCCVYGCQIFSVLRIFFDKFPNSIRSSLLNMVCTSCLFIWKVLDIKVDLIGKYF